MRLNYLLCTLSVVGVIIIAIVVWAGEDNPNWVEENWDKIPNGVKSEMPEASKELGDAPTQTQGEWYAQVELRDELHTVKWWEARIKTKPPMSPEFPETEIRSKVQQSDIVAHIVIRGVSVPENHDRTGPISDVNLERRRFDDAINYVWNMLEACEYFIVANPEWTGEYYLVDVYIEVAGQRLNFKDALIFAGHATDDDKTDWGKRNLR